MNGKSDCQLVIQMIGRTWDRQIATYASQLGGPHKGGRRIILYSYRFLYIVLGVFLDLFESAALYTGGKDKEHCAALQNYQSAREAHS